MSRPHAILSPSASERWLACTPSAMLEALEPDSPPSEYAQEGTDAHTLAELKLSLMLGQISQEEFDTRYDFFVKDSKYYNADFEEFVDSYVKEIKNIIEYDYNGKYDVITLEDVISLEDIIPDGFGTSDVVIVAGDTVHVIDLKFGRGVEVNAVENTQLRLYALGALKKYRLHGPFTKIKTTICQPRLYSNSSETLSVKSIYQWASEYVKPRAELALRGAGELVAGDHCRWCKRRQKCQELGEKQLTAARAEFETVVLDNGILDPKDMTPEMLTKIMQIAPKFIEWFNDIQKYVNHSMIYEDLKLPGYKVVEGRSNRKMTDTDAIQEILRTSGFSEDDYMSSPTLLSLTRLEKNIGKKLFNELCGHYIIKPEGAPTVVPDTDSRPAITNLKNLRLHGQEFDLKIE